MENTECETIPPDPPDYDAVADAMGSYYEAVREIGEQVKAGKAVPWFFRSEKDDAIERDRFGDIERTELAQDIMRGVFDEWRSPKK
jgi:hypothetical protein